MKTRLSQLVVSCHKYQEVVPFADFNYFYGKMGAGKSSIARLIDYCFGGDLDLTPALQSEFVGATLSLSVGGNDLVLERGRGANQVRAQWSKDGELFDTVVPARKPAGEVIHGTGVEVLSDLFFHLAGRVPPKVRRSKIKEDSDLERLSLRDLLWYCYLDQDTMDSQFFSLDSVDVYRRNKSRDVLRFVVGFHQEHVAELEGQLERLRQERTKLEGGAEALRQALQEANVGSETEIALRQNEIEAERARIEIEIQAIRDDLSQLRGHGIEELQGRGRQLMNELLRMEEATIALERMLAEDHRHLNELTTLSSKYRRMTSARAVLRGVEFEACPRCAKQLPARGPGLCRLCEQAESVTEMTESDSQATEKDIHARSTELRDAIEQRESSLLAMRKVIAELKSRKLESDSELTTASRQYDSVYLSRTLGLEQRRARLQGEARELERLRVLPRKVEDQLSKASEIAAREAGLRQELRGAREAAERDTGNVQLLQDLFLDCLVRSRIPGFSRNDIVQLKSPWFLPEVFDPSTEGLATTSFANLGSGGKKTLFKCCFGLAMHRLSSRIGAELPTLMIIDSPMKNISERENREQFEGFHHLLYELAEGELQDTQFVVIDKEFFAPRDGSNLDFHARHMTPDDKTDGPLLKGYKGH